MAGTAIALQLISFLFCCVSGAYLQYGSTRLSDPQPNVTLTVGVTDQRVYCGQATGPVPTSIRWYNPQGQLVSKNNTDEVSQAAAAGGGRTVALTFQSYQRSQGGKYECRVAGPGNNLETLSVCIGPTSRRCVVLPSKVMGVRVTPGVENTSPTLTVTWQALLSGAVTYTVKYSYKPGEVNTPSEGALEVTGISGTSTILTGPKKGTTYYIWVVGVSEGGEGPHSDRTSGLTYDIPGPVSELSYEEDTDTSVNITWKPPKEPNGVIRAYFVEHGVYQNEPTTSVRLHARRGPLYTVIQGLDPGVPYNVTVRAVTAVGKGEPVSIVVFSMQQAPTAQVSNVKVERVNNNRAARVSWTPLTFHQARGLPVYFVTYQPSLQVRRVTRAVNTVSTNQPSVVIDDLDPTTEYTIAVDVRTAGGKLQSSLAAVSATLPRVESESDCRSPAVNKDSIGATGVGLFLGGVVAGVIGVLLIEGIVGGACRLRRSKHKKSSPNGKTAGEEVPMEDDPAYGDVKEPKEN